MLISCRLFCLRFYFPGFTFLVPAHPGSPGHSPGGRKMVVVVVVVVDCYEASTAHLWPLQIKGILQTWEQQ